MSYKNMSVILPRLKEEKEWLNQVNSGDPQQELTRPDSAFHRFFKKARKYPVFKRKRRGGSFSVPQHFIINGNHLAKRIADAGCSFFMTMLKAGVESRGKKITGIGRFDPS